MSQGYTAHQAAERLGCSVATVGLYSKKGLLRKVEDPHRLLGKTHYTSESVEEVLEEIQKLKDAGSSLTDLASSFGVYPNRIKEAVKALEMEVRRVPSSIQSSSTRYAFTKEQEKELHAYLKRQKSTRSKRNHLYLPSVDVALYQSFLLAGEQSVRLKKNDQNEFGFYLENEEFLPYVEALRLYDLEPKYAIHSQKKPSSSGFTDLVVPAGRKAFYQLLDVLYAVCGIENFNAEVHEGQLLASVRNGHYPANSFATQETLALMSRYIKSGSVQLEEDMWIFTRSETSLLISLDDQVYADLKAAANHSGRSLKEWIQQLLIEKRNELRGN